MEPWYKVVVPRQEVRKEGRSFDPNEFAIALEQVIRGTAPPDYNEARKFFSRTVFTRAIKEHLGLVLRRLDGQTVNTAPVMALVTQFGGGKTHTLAALYHLINNPKDSMKDLGIQSMLKEQGLEKIPAAKVAVFVGNAWDPQEGRETPWIDIARQLAGDKGVAALGHLAKESPPGTDALARVYEEAGGSALVLFDETLNFMNRHRKMAEPFYAFLHNLTVSMTGTTKSAAMFSLPRSQVEMTQFDLEWQEKITKIVKRVAKELIANDESEIAEVVRQRLFEDLGPESTRRAVAKAYADWCFERRKQLPPEWTSVDTSKGDDKAREYLRKRFEACYPFHPATLTVFQRKWQTLPQYQQTRGTLAMLAQWVAWAFREGYQKARKEPLITLGSAPMAEKSFKTIVLGQLGEMRLLHALDADLAGENTHAGALDADTKGQLKDIHRRVGTAIFFESSGGMADKVAEIQELRFALGEPGMDTTSIDTAADTLEKKAFYLRKVGREGYRFWHQPRIKKMVGDKKAALDPDEVLKSAREIIKKEFEKGAHVPLQFFPENGEAIGNAPKLTLLILDPDMSYDEKLQGEIAKWTKCKGESPRQYPAALIWVVKKPGRDLLDKVENMLAWKRVAEDIKAGRLGNEFDPTEKQDVQGEVKDSEEAVKDEVWGSYRYVLVYDGKQENGLRPTIDMGAGHSSGSDSLTGRVMAALRSEGLLSESVGAGYLERSWPPTLKEKGVWPLSGIRQSYMDGALVRLPDPEKTLKEKIVEFVRKGDFGLASGERPDGTFDRVWFKKELGVEEVDFDSGVFLVLPKRAERLVTPETLVIISDPGGDQHEEDEEGEKKPLEIPPEVENSELLIRGIIPPEVWNKLGTRLIPKLRSGKAIELKLEACVDLNSVEAEQMENDIKRILFDMGVKEWTFERRKKNIPNNRKR